MYVKKVEYPIESTKFYITLDDESVLVFPAWCMHEMTMAYLDGINIDTKLYVQVETQAEIRLEEIEKV